MLDKIKRYLKYIFIREPNPQKWVFIIGTTNSGTTLLHDILAKHSLIGSLPKEGQFCTDQLPIPKRYGLARLWTKNLDLFYLDEISNPTINIRKMKRQWALNYNDPYKQVLIEKTPANSVRMKWLQKAFPNSYFIGIFRNGYAVAKGIKQKTGCSIAEAAEHWMINNQIILKDFEFLQNKRLIRYEDLTKDPITASNELMDFLGIDKLPHEKISSINFQNKAIKNLNAEAINQLSKDEIETIENVAGNLLKQLNYHL